LHLALLGQFIAGERTTLRRFALAQQQGQGMMQHLAQWMLVVAGGPLQQGPEGRAKEGGWVQHLQQRLEFFRRQIALGRMADDDADQLLAAKDHPYPTTGLRQGQGGEIVKLAAQWHRQGDPHRIEGLSLAHSAAFFCKSIATGYSDPILFAPLKTSVTIVWYPVTRPDGDTAYNRGCP